MANERKLFPAAEAAAKATATTGINGELLAALKTLYSAIGADGDHRAGTPSDDVCMICNAMTTARAAIAKAEAEEALRHA